ncbi:MAG TPA: hypothetical protein VH440_05475 [Candidatus Limnocylindrales bacterium]
MVEETSQINPVEPAPIVEAAASSGASGDAASPWQTNGIIPEPTFKPDAEPPDGEPPTGAAAGAADSPGAESPDGGADEPTSADDGSFFLANLAKAMKDAATAERGRLTEDTDRRREAHLASINARREAEAGRIKELAEEDRKGIEAWVADEQKRIDEERARRTSALETDLETSLAEHGTKIDREIERVEAAITVYRSDVDAYFQRLEGDDDPVTIAQQAGRRPVFPDLDRIGRGVTEAAESAEAKTIATASSGPDSDSDSGGGGAGDGGAAPDAPVAGGPASEGSDAGVPAATATAIASTSLIGVMESGKPPTKLAQAWAAWNESTKAADVAQASDPGVASAAIGTAPTAAVAEPAAATAAPASPVSTPTVSAAPSSGEGNLDASGGPAATATPVAAGTWKPPAEDLATEPAQTASGGALGWLRRDRDRDHGGR